MLNRGMVICRKVDANAKVTDFEETRRVEVDQLHSGHHEHRPGHNRRMDRVFILSLLLVYMVQW